MTPTVEGQRTENKRGWKKDSSIPLQQVKRRKEGESEGQKDGLDMSLHVSGPALNYNEGKKK